MPNYPCKSTAFNSSRWMITHFPQKWNLPADRAGLKYRGMHTHPRRPFQAWPSSLDAATHPGVQLAFIYGLDRPLTTYSIRRLGTEYSVLDESWAQWAALIPSPGYP